jgi:acetyltransferase-like isoleucine patch superfamily enzyme
MPYLSTEELRSLGFKKIGNHVRISDKASIHDADRIEIGDHSRVDDFCVLSGKVTIGRNVHIAVFCNIAGGSEGVVLEDFSGIAYGCHIFSQSDDYSGGTLTGPTVPEKYKNELKKAVRIGRHCIVGTGSIIFPGVVLGEGTSVGAASLITKSTEPWSVYFGSPAKRIKRRKQDLLALEGAYLAEEAP